KALKEFEGQFIVGEMNRERLVRVMLEKVNGTVQGAVTPFLDGHGLRKGNNRLAFAADGSLWVGQTDHGWLGDRGVQRVSFDNLHPFEVKKMELTKEGFDLTFTKPLSQQEKEAVLAAISLKKYNYHYHAKYGSPQINLSEVPINDLKIHRNRKRLALTLPSIEKGFVYELTLDSLFSKNQTDTMINKIVAYTVKETK